VLRTAPYFFQKPRNILDELTNVVNNDIMANRDMANRVIDKDGKVVSATDAALGKPDNA
jgi:hypothetical protein